MANVSDFIKEQNHYERELAEFMGWEFVEGQKKGSSYDCITSNGQKVELKMDWGSKTTGNHYLEFSQKSSSGSDWVPSGFTLSKETSDYWIVVNNDFMYISKTKEVERMINEKGETFRVTTTRPGINNNVKGQYSKAYLVPLDILEEYAVGKLKSPINNPKEYK